MDTRTATQVASDTLLAEIERLERKAVKQRKNLDNALEKIKDLKTTHQTVTDQLQIPFDPASEVHGSENLG